MTVYALTTTRQLLLKLKLFQGMTEADVSTMLNHAELLEYEAGIFPIREGEQGQHLFVLMAGQVEIIKRGIRSCKVIKTLGPGECFGEMSLIECRARSASVKTTCACRLLRIDGAQIAAMPDIAIKLYRNIAILLSQRLRHANELLALG